MAIRNDLMGGSDWTASEILKATDLNDTVNYIGSLVKQNPAFWYNTSLYTVYDDFDSYSTGAFTSNTKWVVTSTKGTCTIESSTLAGGSNQELKMGGTGNDTSLNIALATSQIPDNTHVWMRLYFTSEGLNDDGGTPSGIFKAGLGTSSLVTVAVGAGQDGSDLAYLNLLRIAKDSDTYDLYAGGKIIVADYDGSSDAQIKFTVTTTGTSAGKARDAFLYIDDVRYSTQEIYDLAGV